MLKSSTANSNIHVTSFNCSNYNTIDNYPQLNLSLSLENTMSIDSSATFDKQQQKELHQQPPTMMMVSPNRSVSTDDLSTGSSRRDMFMMLSSSKSISSSIDKIDLFDSAFAKQRRSSSTDIDMDNINKMIMNHDNERNKSNIENSGKDMMIVPEKLLVPFVLSATPTREREGEFPSATTTKTTAQALTEERRDAIHSLNNDVDFDEESSLQSITFLDEDSESESDLLQGMTIANKKDEYTKVREGEQLSYSDIIAEILSPPSQNAVPSRRKKIALNNVTFAPDIEYREYSVVQYDHPSCKDGLALSLDWEHTEPYTLPFDIVCKERNFFYMQPTKLSYNERRQRLQTVAPLSYIHWRDEILLGGKDKKESTATSGNSSLPSVSSSKTLQSAPCTSDDLSSIISRLQQTYSNNKSLMSITNILLDDDDDEDVHDDDDDDDNIINRFNTLSKAVID